MSRIFNRVGIFRRLFVKYRLNREAVDRAMRWSTIADQQPLLAEDIIIMGEVIALGDVDDENRLKATDLELAYDRGRRDLALDILAMMHISPHELNQLLKETTHETRNHD